MPTDGVRQLGAALDHPLTGPQQHQRRLFLGALDRHEAHRRPAHRLTAAFGVAGVVLVARHVPLHVLRRDQPNLMAKTAQHPRPLVRGPARLEPHDRRLQLAEERHHLTSTEFAAKRRLLGSAHPMQLIN